MSKNKRQPTAPTAAKRRSANSVMVLVSVLAAIGIAAIANYVVYWQYRGLSPEARSWVRFDLTSTRRYSLSEQSRAVLDQLDTEHRVVTMLGGDTIEPAQQQRIRDLVDEYARASSSIDVQHIDLDTQTDRREALLAEMDAMFAEDTESIRQSIAEGLRLVDRYAETINKIESWLGTIIDNGVKLRPASIQNQRLADLHSQYLRLQDQAKRLKQLRDDMLGSDWQKRLESPGVVTDGDGENLPDYTALMANIQQYILQLAGSTLPDTPGKADQLRRGVVIDNLAPPETQQTAREAQNSLAAMVQQVPEFFKLVRRETDPLLNVLPPLRYRDARAILNDKPCVLLTSGSDARVIPADLLFRGTGDTSTSQVNDLFVGEEQLTGALISIQLEPPPLVVFIRSNIGLRAVSITGSEQHRIEGVYDEVTKRLLAMDFEVAEWPDPVNTDPPPLREGQRAVWVTLPYFRPDVNRSESLDNTNKDTVAAFLQERLAKGDGAMVMLYANGDTAPRLRGESPPDTLVQLLGTFGIDAQLYQSAVQLQSEDDDGEDRQYTNQFIVNQWPKSPIVGDALNGINTFFTYPIPVELTPQPHLKQTPLVEVAAPIMHVQEAAADGKTGQFTPAPGSERQRVVIGAAVEKGDGRLVTIGSATWAMDEVLSLAALPDGTVGPNLAERPGARILYPGNSDLFVNSICWLAHEEALIAASPRTQDIRRIQPMSSGALKTTRILLWAGMPAAILVLGISVGLMRRRA
ncbi:MAG: GldG family protein [Phycisphaeraceae bacterium]|nr:GldG family protein [Phycisphaeraceae bacterium]